MNIKCEYKKLLPIKSLKAHPKNRNKHPADQIDQLARVIEYQGWRHPIIVSNLSGFIVAGHGRLEAAKKLKLTEVPVDYQDFESEAQEYAFLQSDNAIALWAELDLSGINADLGELGPDFDIDLLGIKNFTIDVAEKQGLTDEDAVPDAPKEAKTKRGDIYRLGNHRLMCGNSNEESDLAALMDGGMANLIFTSPPYNQKLDSFKPSGMQSESPNWVNKMGGAYFDSKPEPDYQQEQIDLLAIIYAFTTENASLFYNHKIRYRDKSILTPYVWLSRSAWKIRQEIIWDRGGSITLNARMFIPCDERIYWLTKGDFVFNDTTEIKSWSSVWRIAPKNEIKGVSAPFPNELPERGILACSNPREIVLDPYCGTGTTLIAAEKHDRICRGMEVNPNYCDVIVSRWEQFTGKKAELLNA